MLVFYIWYAFIPYWNVKNHKQSSSILDFDVRDLDWIIYGRVIVTQSPLHSTRIIYCVSLLCADNPWTGAVVPNSGLSFSRFTTRVIDTNPTTDFAGPGLWSISLRWIVCLVLNLRVAFQSMQVPEYRLPGSPLTPTPRLQVRSQ